MVDLLLFRSSLTYRIALSALLFLFSTVAHSEIATNLTYKQEQLMLELKASETCRIYFENSFKQGEECLDELRATLYGALVEVKELLNVVSARKSGGVALIPSRRQFYEKEFDKLCYYSDPAHDAKHLASCSKSLLDFVEDLFRSYDKRAAIHLDIRRHFSETHVSPPPPPQESRAVPAQTAAGNPSVPNQKSGGPYICFGSQELSFAGCKARYVYLCNSSASEVTRRVFYEDGAAGSKRTLSVLLTAPANARPNAGAPELQGSSMYGLNNICFSRNWTIAAPG